MPEGPEVEVVTRQVRRVLGGSRIVRGRSLHERFLAPPPGEVASVRRHGKWMVVHMASGEAFVANLGMSGRFVTNELPAHVKWEALVRGPRGLTWLRYVDPRGFGHARRLTRTQARDVTAHLRLGPDAETLDEARLWRAVLHTPTPIKRALLDQHRVAGLGNIYASEACHLAGVHPSTPAECLSDRQLRLLGRRVPLMLRASVLAGGTSFGDANTYRDADGREGKNSRNLRVYGRAGEGCRCGGTVVVSRDGGRATYWCDACQAA